MPTRHVRTSGIPSGAPLTPRPRTRRRRRATTGLTAAIALLLTPLPGNLANADTVAAVDPSIEVTCPTSPVPGVDVSATQTYAHERELSATSADHAIDDFEVTIDPEPDAGQVTVTGIAPADAPGDTATATLALGADLAPGEYTATITASSGEPANSCTAEIEVLPLVPIGAVQGVIEDDQTSFTSPLLGERVAARGVVTQVTREGNGNRGFLLQERADATDDDPRSSDGIFVFNGRFTTLRTEANSPAADEFGGNWDVTIGDEVVVRGEVGQYFGMTQFAGSSSFVWDRTDTGLDVDAAVEITEIDPPEDDEDSLRYFRRNLGMQMQVPAGSLVVNGRDVFSGTDAEVWAIRGDHPVAERTEPYERRVFRDAHPLDNRPDTDFDDGNGYRFVLGSFGVKGAADDPDAVLAPAKTFDTISTAVRGGVYLSFGKYTVNVAEQLALDTDGADPAANAPVPEPEPERQISVAAYNVENLYDFRDSPNSGCDFVGNNGCSSDHGSVDPPFDYVPAGDAEYQARLQRIAEQIRLDLHSPDIVAVQETEAQDVCTVDPEWTPGGGAELGADRLECDLDNAGDDNTATDGRPDSLLELALVIAEQGGPEYNAVFDLDAGDLRGITTAYLYRTDRVELRPDDPDDPVLGSEPQIDYAGSPAPFNADVQNPKAFNAALPDEVADRCTGSGPNACDGPNVYSRGPSVGHFRVWRDGIGTSSFTDLYLVDNHFSSGPQDRVRQRTEQATYNARIAETILKADPDARVLLAGDFNVFPRPDDPYAPGEHIQGIGPGPSDQLRGLYDSDLTNLYDVLLAEHPASAYTFGFAGQAQTLDQIWVGPTLLDELDHVRSAKINADWPADAVGQEPAYGRHGASDHDPEVVRFVAAPTIDRVRALLDHLVDTGELDADHAAAIRSKLAVAAQHLEDGRPQAATHQLNATIRTIDGYRRAGLITSAVADGLVGEIGMLGR